MVFIPRRKPELGPRGLPLECAECHGDIMEGERWECEICGRAFHEDPDCRPAHADIGLCDKCAEHLGG